MSLFQGIPVYRYAAKFDETKIKRDDDGQFAEKEGSGKPSLPEKRPKANKPEKKGKRLSVDKAYDLTGTLPNYLYTVEQMERNAVFEVEDMNDGQRKFYSKLLSMGEQTLAKLDDKNRAAYKYASAMMVRHMTPKCFEQIGKNVEEILFFDTARQVRDDYNRERGTNEKEDCAGIYNPKIKKLWSSGQLNPAAGFTHAENLAHEMGHAIDGQDEYSSDPEWMAAWKDEVVNQGMLSKYGASKPFEGFAEMARALYGLDLEEKDRNYIRESLPKCYAFFESRGLV